MSEAVSTLRETNFITVIVTKKSSLYLRYYAEACNEWWGLSPPLRAWTTQLQRSITAVASHWRHCPGIEPRISRAESDVFNHSANLSALPKNEILKKIFFSHDDCYRIFAYHWLCNFEIEFFILPHGVQETVDDVIADDASSHLRFLF